MQTEISGTNTVKLRTRTVLSVILVIRVKSNYGMLDVIEAFSNYTEHQKKFEYQIPDFCPCEEIYDSEQAIIIGEGSYFREDGPKKTIVLNSGTTILKYTGTQIRNIKEQLSSCEGKN